jgi:3-deoxy-D-manno-octulosonic-acid transferase
VSRPRPLSLRLYALALGLAEPFGRGFLDGRARRGKEDPARLGERLGHATAARPEGSLIWLHGASVGESLSLLPLADTLREERPQSTILATSGTVTSAELLSRRLPAGVIHQYAPIDTPGAVKRFLAHWRPDLAVIAESELWPNLILETKDAGAKLALVSAKMSEKSLAGWSRWPGAAKALMDCYDLILAQDARSAERLRSLGGKIDGLVDLKFGAAPLPSDDDGLDALRAQLGSRDVVLAASTHPGEDAMVLDAFRASSCAEASLLIIAPRHIERGADIAALAQARGLSTALRSGDDAPATARVYVADTLGELGLWFRLARIAFVGGSLVAGPGGHNPLEPARLFCPVVSGPKVDNWASVYEGLAGAKGVETAASAEDLARVFDASPEALRSMASRAAEYVSRRDAEAAGARRRIVELAP